MLIRYASDLHLEFPDNEKFIRENPLAPGADVLILAGDIVPFRHIDRYAWFFNYVANHFPVIYWVPGNHEYYHYDLSFCCGSVMTAIRDNVFLVNDQTVTIGQTQLIFSTLWTKIKPQHQINIERRMNDFHLIRYKGNRLTAADLDALHESSAAYIETELLQAPAGTRKIVITHHVPTFINYPPEYLGDILNEAFAVELKELIRKAAPDYWLYGHHHRNIPDYKIGETIMTTNQLGYVVYNENSLFDSGKTLNTAG